MVRDSKQTIFKPLRYCERCNIFRPPTRCSHCYTCNACIVGFDHHCIWLGTCIGARNYLDFLVFLISLSSLIIFTEYTLVAELIDLESGETLFSALGSRIHVSVVVPACILFLLLVGLLLSFHIMLVCKNVTTHEFLKNTYDMSSKSPNKKMQATINPFVVQSIHGNIWGRIKSIYKRMRKSRSYPSVLQSV